MTQYRKKHVVEASQWFKDGDHPAVIRKTDPDRYGDEGIPWCPTLEGGHIVTPGDWILTGIQGEHWPVKADIFAATYELASAAPAAPPVQPAERELLIEPVARAIYEQWKTQPGYVPWQDGGNSDKQYQAREYARAAITSVTKETKK